MKRYRFSHTTFALLLSWVLGTLGAGGSLSQRSETSESAQLVWDPSTLVLIQPNGVYGRMARLQNREILCAFEARGKIFVRHSRDEGKTWEPEIAVAEFPFGTAANPELLVRKNGTVLLFYNERPNDGIHPYAIRATTSYTHGKTWTEHRTLYFAGTDSGTGCWEPAAVELPNGEMQLFFANEKPFPDTDEQEITLLRSLDGGISWGEPERAGYRAGHRDGMPVPLVLAGGRGSVVAIEDNGIAGRFKPAILYSPAELNWKQPFVAGDSPRRWAALNVQLPDAVYAGAPYIRQFPTGETVLSVQSAEGRPMEGTHRYSRMVVYLGNAEARNFGSPSVPFDVPQDSSGLWNSLFIKNSRTVTAISGTVVNGVRGLWAIDGYLRPAALQQQKSSRTPRKVR